MNRSQRTAVLLSLIKALRSRGSWCGETHVQKACYFLQDLTRVPLELEFVLYKYGPYSFELTDELTAMRANSMLTIVVPDPRYGPSYVPSELGDSLLERYPKTMARHRQDVEFVAHRLGNKGVAELERLSTALYVLRTVGAAGPDDAARKIAELKPHVSNADAKVALREVERMLAEHADSGAS